MPASLRVREIPPGASLRPFIDVAWRENARDPAWVPPLRLPLSTLLDRRKHPFHQHADVAYFLAERGGKAVGRIAAIVNHRHNEFHEERSGFVGFFESDDDVEVSRALFDAATAWLRQQGMERVLGPFNFSTNEECGLLVDGFETRPTIMMTHNPRYYPDLWEAAGWEKAKDLLAYRVEGAPPERLVRGMERLANREGVQIRSLNMRRFQDEVAAIQDIYNSAWARNWGFVPMTDAEFAFLAKEMKPVVDPELCLLAEVRGEPVGFSLALPDLNQALKYLPNGRLLPLGIARLLWHRRHINGIRVLTLGFKPGFQHQGLGAAFYLRTFQSGIARGYRVAEASWILEDNWDMRRPLEKMGGEPYKRYRIYERSL